MIQAPVSRAELSSLLQMQAEAVGLLRNPIKNAHDLVKAQNDLAAHNNFITQIGRLSTRLQLPLEVVFQCLMHMSHHANSGTSHQQYQHQHLHNNNNNNSQADFDRQHSQGAVPMHQAKVLKREGLAEIQPKLVAAVPADKLEEMVHFSSSLRTLLRMKVEDGNDLSMARRAMSLADDYMQRIARLANNDSSVMWKLFNANDENELARSIGGSDDDAAAATAPLSGTAGGGASSYQGTLSPLPPLNQIPSTVEHLCKKSLVSISVAVGERQQALANIEHWFRQLSVVVENEDDGDDDVAAEDDSANNRHLDSSSKKSKFTPELIRAIFALPSFRKGIAVHVGEKRSALCRSACDIVSSLLQNIAALDMMLMTASSSPSTTADIKESLTLWLEVFLKQVHVTVSAIATATDATVRDMMVATGGHISLMNMTAQVATSATQPELQRKCMGYLALGVVAHIHTFDASEVDPAAKCSIVASTAGKLLKSGSDAVRRAARVAGIVCSRVSPSIPIPGWDDRVEKAAAAEVRVIVGSAASAGTSNFELAALKYPEPCLVSQNCPERQCSISLQHGDEQQESGGPSTRVPATAPIGTGSRPVRNLSTSDLASSASSSSKALMINSNSLSSNLSVASSSSSTGSGVPRPLPTNTNVAHPKTVAATSLASRTCASASPGSSSSSATSATHSSLSSHIQQQRTKQQPQQHDQQQQNQLSLLPSTSHHLPVGVVGSATATTTTTNSCGVPPARKLPSTSSASLIPHSQHSNSRGNSNGSGNGNGAMPLLLSFAADGGGGNSLSQLTKPSTIGSSTANSTGVARSREPASPQTECHANRGIVPGNTAVTVPTSTSSSSFSFSHHHHLQQQQQQQQQQQPHQGTGSFSVQHTSSNSSNTSNVMSDTLRRKIHSSGNVARTSGGVN